MTRLVLASSSPARLALLRSAGIEPEIVLPETDEPALAAQAKLENPNLSAQELVGLLAKAKAESVLHDLSTRGALILGGDSALEFQGEILGKPHEPEVALERWAKLSGNVGVLHSGHYLIDNRDPANPVGAQMVSSTKVFFSKLSNQEIADYVATGEPLKVAGAFTIDGLGGAFIDRIEGDSHTVVGLSLKVLRELAAGFGVHYPSFWR
ncbi:Maf Nucleotide-binding protein implicated in inhibition of septum formation [Microbacteriaceae bacterium]